MNHIKILYIDCDGTKSKNVWDLICELEFEFKYVTNEENIYNCCKMLVPDIIILNSNNLDEYFFQLILLIRSFDFKIPIILCSVSEQEAFAQKALMGGIDICIIKRNSEECFLIQMQSIIKVLARHKYNDINEVKLGNSSFYNIAKRDLCIDNNSYKLTPLEGRLFCLLCHNLNKTTYRNNLLLAGWESNNIQYDVQLNKYIVKFRKLLSIDTSIKLVTVKGFGYCLEIN